MRVATSLLLKMPSWYAHRKCTFIFYPLQFTASTYIVLYIGWGGGGGRDRKTEKYQIFQTSTIMVKELTG
jgi:hypothetical protein